MGYETVNEFKGSSKGFSFSLGVEKPLGETGAAAVYVCVYVCNWFRTG